MSASVEHSRKAERAEGRAAEVQRQTRRRENPVVMGRRIERLERDQRTLERRLRGAGEAPNTRAELADIKTEIEFLQSAIVATGVKQYTRADLGDEVKIRGRWDTVLKANSKTVETQGAHGLRIKYPYYEITGHERPRQRAELDARSRPPLSRQQRADARNVPAADCGERRQPPGEAPRLSAGSAFTSNPPRKERPRCHFTPTTQTLPSGSKKIVHRSRTAQRPSTPSRSGRAPLKN